MRYKDLNDFKNFLKEKEEMKFFERNFTYFIFKNLTAVDAEIAVVDKMRNTIAENNQRFFEYEKIKNETILSYCDKDANGKPIVYGNQPQIQNDVMPELETALKNLYEEYKLDIEKLEKEDAEFKNFLDSEVENMSAFITIKDSDIPKNISISPKEWGFLDCLVKR